MGLESLEYAEFVEGRINISSPGGGNEAKYAKKP